MGPLVNMCQQPPEGVKDFVTIHNGKENKGFPALNKRQSFPQRNTKAV